MISIQIKSTILVHKFCSMINLLMNILEIHWSFISILVSLPDLVGVFYVNFWPFLFSWKWGKMTNSKVLNAEISKIFKGSAPNPVGSYSAPRPPAVCFSLRSIQKVDLIEIFYFNPCSVHSPSPKNELWNAIWHMFNQWWRGDVISPAEIYHWESFK